MLDNFFTNKEEPRGNKDVVIQEDAENNIAGTCELIFLGHIMRK